MKKTVFTPQTQADDINVKCDSIWPYSEGFAAVKLNGKWGYIDESKKLIIPAKYDYAEPFSEGIASVFLNGKFGCIDKKGDIIIPFQYDGIGCFHEGVAWIQKKQDKKLKWGFIDKKGTIIIPLKYDFAENFNFGHTFVRVEDKWYVINQKGEEFNFELCDAGTELYRLKVNGKIGYIDSTDKLVTPIKYDKANRFFENTALVKIGDKLGLVDKTGEIVPPKYDEISAPSEGFRVVRLDNKFGYINEQGEEITAIKFDTAGDMKNGVAKVTIEGRPGLVGEKGELTEFNP